MRRGMGIARPSAIALLVTVSLVACSRSKDSPPATDSAPAKADPAKVAAEVCAGATPHGPLRWFHDDYARALACARAVNKPLFIDLWAPWCHTCIAMKHGVFVDRGLAPMADRFVWLAIDTDKEVNAALQTRFPAQVWPTFYVVSPADEAVQARYLGAASLAQLRELLLTGEQGFLDATRGTLPPDSPLRLVRDGDRAMAAGRLEDAATAYRAALTKVPADWPRRPEVLVALISALSRSGQHEACVELGAAEMDRTGTSASATDFIYQMSNCASALDEARARPLRERAIERLRALIDDAAAPLSRDDRSDAMANLRGLYDSLGKKDEARAMAERQRTFLDLAAAQAPTPFAAMTYNWPRAEVYVYLGKAAELVPALEQSVRALPSEYDPPYRLAWIYLQMGELDKALAAGERALSLAYGPRKTRVQGLVADIHEARGDRAAERAARQAVVDIYENLPEGQKNPAGLEQARAELAAMDADAGGK